MASWECWDGGSILGPAQWVKALNHLFILSIFMSQILSTLSQKCLSYLSFPFHSHSHNPEAHSGLQWLYPTIFPLSILWKVLLQPSLLHCWFFVMWGHIRITSSGSYGIYMCVGGYFHKLIELFFFSIHCWDSLVGSDLYLFLFLLKSYLCKKSVMLIRVLYVLWVWMRFGTTALNHVLHERTSSISDI